MINSWTCFAVDRGAASTLVRISASRVDGKGTEIE
jgi:hypothetical protein